MTFLITDSSSAVIGPNNGEYITGDDGRITIDNLEPGTTITAKEIKVPEGVILDTLPKSIQIKAGEGQTLRFVNKKAGTLVIRKLDKITKAPLAGAEFELTYAEGGFVDDANGHLSSKGRYTTNDMGEIRLSVTGTVVAKEVTPSLGYVIDATTQTQTVTVNPADTQTITFYNEPLCSLTLSKKDSVSGKPVPGTEFTVRDSSGAIIGKYTTGSHGTVTVTGLIPGSTVVVTETKVPKGYVLNPTPQTIVVKNGTGNSWVSGGTVSSGTNSSGGSSGSGNNGGVSNGTVSGGGTSGGNNLDFENDPTTILTIQKFVDGTNNEPMKGVEFLITDGTGAVVGPNNGYYTTDKDGRITIPNLEPGTSITARETKTLEGFLLDPTPQTITIKVGEGQHLTFWNKKAGGLIVNKVDAETKKPLAGVKFKITYADGTNVDMDGGKVSSNGLYITDTNGQIKILGITGTVIVEEIDTLPGYVIDPNAKSQTVVINANDTQTLTFVRFVP